MARAIIKNCYLDVVVLSDKTPEELEKEIEQDKKEAEHMTEWPLIL